MATHDRASDAFDPEVWLSADRIAALSGGRAKPTTVRSWWAAGILDFRVFPELGAKSNKRSHRSDVERFLRIKYGDFFPEPQPHPGHDPQPQESRLRDLIDTLTSVKAAAESAMQALVAEAEHHAASTAAQAAISRAQAEADTIRAEADLKRVETLKHLQQMVHVYDLALTTYVQPDSPGTLTPRD